MSGYECVCLVQFKTVCQDIRAQLPFSLRQSEITAASQTEHLNISLPLRKHKLRMQWRYYTILPALCWFLSQSQFFFKTFFPLVILVCKKVNPVTVSCMVQLFRLFSLPSSWLQDPTDATTSSSSSITSLHPNLSACGWEQKEWKKEKRREDHCC